MTALQSASIVGCTCDAAPSREAAHWYCRYLLDRNNMKTAFYKQQVATGTLISAPAVYTGTDGQTYIVVKVRPVMPRSIALRSASQD